MKSGENALKIGQFDFDGESIITIPRIGVGDAGSFVFYIINGTQNYIEFSFGSDGKATSIKSGKEESVDVRVTHNKLMAWPSYR